MVSSLISYEEDIINTMRRRQFLRRLQHRAFCDDGEIEGWGRILGYYTAICPRYSPVATNMEQAG